MKNLTAIAYMNTSLALPMVLLSVALATPTYSNTFHGVNTTLNRNVGSAPNPTARDIRNNRQGLVYPLESQVLNEEGTVGLRIFLTDEGAMRDAVVENSSGFSRLDDAALEYVKGNWRYQPKDTQQPMPAVVRVKVTFDLQ